MRILVHHDGQQLGPYTLEEARAALAGGALRPGDLAWQEGTSTWVPLAGLLAGAGGPPVTPGALPQPAMPPTGTQTSALAVTSLVLGILSIPCLSVLSGIPAVICGHIARSQIKRAPGTLGGAGLALAGLITGYISIALVPILAALAIPAFTHAVQAGKAAQSVNQARTIAAACAMYANANDDAFPATLEELVPDYLPDESALSCPLQKEPDTVGYHYFGGSQTDPPDKVLLVSKAEVRKGQRVVARVGGDTRVERYAPPKDGR